MEIIRYCGKERLPGGERLWRKLAREAGFTGTVFVAGWGTAGLRDKVVTHFQFERAERPTTVCGYYESNSNKIVVYVKCACQAVDESAEAEDEDSPAWLESPKYDPLFTFAHELGHHKQFVEAGMPPGGMNFSERGANRRGHNLLEKVVNGKGSSRVQGSTGEDSVTGRRVEEGCGSNPSQCDETCQRRCEEGESQAKESQVSGPDSGM